MQAVGGAPGDFHVSDPADPRSIGLDMDRLQIGRAADDLGEVIALLERQAKRTFDAFIVLTAEHPASELLPALLLPINRK